MYLPLASDMLSFSHSPEEAVQQVLDEQHRLLFQLIEGLRTAISAASNEVISDYFVRLLSYATLHFATEERVMLEVNFPDFAAHRHEHETALAKLSGLEEAYRAGDPAAPQETVRFLEFWWRYHIPNTDGKLEEYLSSRAKVDAA